MSWTEFTGGHYERSKYRYSRDVFDDEWTIVAPLFPTANRPGRPRELDRRAVWRAVWNAIGYDVAVGCALRLLPEDFPPVLTVRCHFYERHDNGLLAEINRIPVVVARCEYAETIRLKQL